VFRIRTAAVSAVGIAVGWFGQSSAAQNPEILGLNHVALSVTDFDEAARFYTQTLGFREAFRFVDSNGRPAAYFQVNRGTFIELMSANPQRPAGFVHFGLEVAAANSVVTYLRAHGMDVRNASVSPRSGAAVAVGTTPQGTSVELIEALPGSAHRKAIDSWK
jgi:catechol 2,3-dioxygenase-like lactoylglutathione lyase family enzyme